MVKAETEVELVLVWSLINC